jgi:hypothetical protein
LFLYNKRCYTGVINNAKGESSMNCCNNDCNQGRNCPARQSCELPDEESLNGAAAMLWAAVVVLVLVIVGLSLWVVA